MGLLKFIENLILNFEQERLKNNANAREFIEELIGFLSKVTIDEYDIARGQKILFILDLINLLKKQQVENGEKTNNKGNFGMQVVGILDNLLHGVMALNNENFDELSSILQKNEVEKDSSLLEALELLEDQWAQENQLKKKMC